MNRDILIKTIYTLLVVLILMVLSVYVLLPYFTIDKINLDSELSFKREFIEVAGLNKNSSYLFLNVESVKNKLLREPLVRKVFIEKSFPDTLNITVYGREALAVAYSDRDGVSTPLCFDENGVVFKVGGDVDDVDLPVISGDIDFENVTAGGEIPVALVPLLKSLKGIRKRSPDLYASISEIYINKRGDMTFDLTLHFTFTSIKALVKGILTSQELKNIIVVTSLLHEKKVTVDLVDFRADEIVYRNRG